MSDLSLPVKELGAFIRSNPVVLFRLVSRDGAILVPYNINSKQKEEHIKKIEKYLASSLASDTDYFLNYRGSTRSKPETIHIYTGTLKAMSEAAPSIQAPRYTEPEARDVRTYREALSDATEIERLKGENARLQAQLDELTSEGEDETALADIASHPAVTIFKEIGLPLLEKWFELKEKEVSALAAGRQQMPVGPDRPVVKSPYSPPPVRPVTPQPAPQRSVIYSAPSGGGGGGGGGSSSSDDSATPQDPEMVQFMQFMQIATLDDIIKMGSAAAEAGQPIDLLALVEQYRPDLYNDILTRLQG